jgi:hypothetical protein
MWWIAAALIITVLIAIPAVTIFIIGRRIKKCEDYD